MYLPFFQSIPDSSIPPLQEGNSVNHTVYREYLRTRYHSQKTASSQWPPVPVTKVIKLAMIKKEKIQRGRIDDDFVRLSITGKVDDILQQKTRVDLKNIFSDCGDNRKIVLLEGAPGSGKSTLALHICQEWADGKLFQEYSVVVLVRLRDPLIRNAKSVADLLPCVNQEMANEMESTIETKLGEDVLWVLDGWDELPSDLPSDSIIHKLIQPTKFRESPLLKSSVIVTSRPSSSSGLHPLVSSRVEVLGFTPHELEQYFRECLNGDSGAVQTLLERIRENPIVEGSCYLPLNAAIVAHVFISGDNSLPTSNHEIFTAVVESSLKRYLQDKLGKTTSVRDITYPVTLPSEVRDPFNRLCTLAFNGIESNKVTFSEDDLTTLSISRDISEVGLLQSVPSIISGGHQIYFCFLHLSIQELLAAVHISHMTPKQQISFFQNIFGKPRFRAVFQFYAGITKLRTSRPWLSKLPRFLCPVPASVYDLVRKVVKKENSRPLLVSLFHCLYEAEDNSLCEFVAELFRDFLSRDHTLILTYTTLSPLDCLSLGYFLSVVSTTVSGGFTVDLWGCSIGDQECKFLVRGLCKCINPNSKVTSQLDVNLGFNDIHEEGMYHIAQLLKNTSVVCKLTSCGNPIGEGGLKSLCETLSTNTTLKHLNLNSCSLTISEENGHLLCQLLSTNTSLSYLRLSCNTITDCRHIAAGLSNNKTLQKLELYDCGLTDKSVNDLSSGLNNYIRELNIGGNNSITESGLRTFARHLTTLSAFRRLWVPRHLKSTINTVFSEVNEERRRNGLPKIEVEAKGECVHVHTVR